MSIIDALERFLSSPEVPSDPGHPLARAVRDHMPEASDETRRVVAAIAGLLGMVAHADRDFSHSEEKAMRAELQRIHGLEAEGVEAILDIFRGGISETLANGDHGWVRDLRELTGREQRVEILEVLLQLAAADGAIDHAEVNYLRRLATQLGLEQQDYNAAQARHRDKLGVLG